MVLLQAPLPATHQDFHGAFRKLAIAFLIRNLDDLLIATQRAKALHWLEVELRDPESLWHAWLDDLGLRYDHIEAQISRQLTRRRGHRGRSVLPWNLKLNQQGDE
jgi:hypothetical protein